MIDVHDGQRDYHVNIVAEKLELHARHRAGCVLYENLVDRDGDVPPRYELTRSEVTAQQLVGERL